MSRPTWQERLFAKAAPNDNGCWIWTARSISRRGYARFWGEARPGRPNPLSYAHLWAYIAANGDVPAGHEVDHLCNVPLCINPAHLEAVTPEEHHRRTLERRGGYVRECLRGHAYDFENTRVLPNGYRQCRACDLARSRRRSKRVAA